jgi:threonine aldolase
MTTHGPTEGVTEMNWVDLRSDTVTRPTEGMRRAIATAEVGDDVFGEDPTVLRLEERTAALLGKEAGLFVASGTMGNLVALLTHAGRGDEIILGDRSHTFLYEVGGCSGLGGIHPHVLHNLDDGTLELAAVEAAIRDPANIHYPRTRVICLENTHNRCGGIALPLDYTDAVAALAERYGVVVHLDGARLFNAAIALGVEPKALARCADSVTICLSKGLGAPVGSVLCGERPFIEEARRARKAVGGGMRQAGILAAAGLYALDHHVERLAEDHANAARLAAGIDELDGLSCDQAGGGPWSNMVYFGATIGRHDLDARVLAKRLKERGVLALPLGAGDLRIRMVTHLDVSRVDIDAALDALRSSLRGT